MPNAVIHRRNDAEPRDRRALALAVNRAMIAALKVPEDTHPVRVAEYDADAFLIPGAAGPGFTLVEVTVYPGRTMETKRRLYRAITGALAALGVAPEDQRIVLYEVPLENWALHGGTPASEIDLGFAIEI